MVVRRYLILVVVVRGGGNVGCRDFVVAVCMGVCVECW